MKLTRLAALLAVPVGLSLAACSGGTNAGSTGLGNITGQQAYVRFLNGSPALGSVSLAIQASGTGTPTGSFVSSLPYAEATDFIPEPTTAQTLFIAPAGTTAPASAATYSCTIPQFANNVKYDIVLAKTTTTANNCLVFQDQDYTSTPQVRFHDASATAANGSFDFGNSTTAGSFTVLGNGVLGNPTIGNGSPTTFTNVVPVNLGGATSTTNVTFAIGASTAAPGQASGSTETAAATFGSQFLLPPNSTTTSNSAGTVNAPGTAGTSLFALDCSGATLPAGATCTNGTTLIGYTDSK